MNCLRKIKSFFYNVLRATLCLICSFAAFMFCQTLWGFRIKNGWGPPEWSSAEMDTCPACYGLDACSALSASELDYYCSRFSTFSIVSILGVKNVYFACSRSYGDVVVKRLGHNRQLNKLDAEACRILEQEHSCEYDRLTDPSHSIERKIHDIVSYKRDTSATDEFGMILCPNSRNMNKFVSTFLLQENNTSLLNNIILVNIWTILNINPEPIIMKYINNSTEGWPVPTYLGACGRVTLQTYEGEMLRDFMSEPWLNRARISVNLLKAADLFTFNHSEFRFYLTDVSLENIVMSNNKKWEPIFVDLENIIVVDKNVDIEDQSEEWSTTHTSEVIECSDCFAFSSEKVCQHHLSDHNHYVFCKLIDDFVLHSTPDSIQKLSPSLTVMLRQCVAPSDDTDRFMAAKTLTKELEHIIEQSI